MDDSSIPAKQTNTFSINRRKVSSCTVISFIFVFFLFSSANALSQLDPINGIRLGWNKRGGGGRVNFSPGWGKRRSMSYFPSSSKRAVNFSPSWGKRNVVESRFSDLMGKRSGGSV